MSPTAAPPAAGTMKNSYFPRTAPAPAFGLASFAAGDAMMPTGGTQQPTLSVTRAGTGTGTVTSSPAGITCGATCSAQFAPGTIVTLSQTPTSGSTFSGW